MPMDQELLGLSVDAALDRLRETGIEPKVTVTRAPKRDDQAHGELRVVRIAQDGSELTAAAFVNPLARGQQEARL